MAVASSVAREAGAGDRDHDLRRGRGSVERVLGGAQNVATPVNERVVETEFDFDRHAATDLSWPSPSSCHSVWPVSGPVRKDGRNVTSAVI
jgi:hypothetical protein